MKSYIRKYCITVKKYQEVETYLREAIKIQNKKIPIVDAYYNLALNPKINTYPHTSNLSETIIGYFKKLSPHFPKKLTIVLVFYSVFKI
jgi:hypothetical protein